MALVLVGKVLTETYEERHTADGLPSTGLHKYVHPFVDADVVHIDGAAHGLATADLVVMIYERQGMTLHGVSADVRIDELSYDVLITLLQPMSGRVVLLA